MDIDNSLSQFVISLNIDFIFLRFFFLVKVIFNILFIMKSYIT